MVGAVLYRPEHGGNLANNHLKIVNRPNRLFPRSPEHPGSIVGLVAQHPFVERRRLDVGNPEMRPRNAADRFSPEPLSLQLIGQAL